MDNDQDPVECPDCEGFGYITYYVGTYGTSDCSGPAERICHECNGEGVVDV